MPVKFLRLHQGGTHTEPNNILGQLYKFYRNIPFRLDPKPRAAVSKNFFTYNRFFLYLVELSFKFFFYLVTSHLAPINFVIFYFYSLIRIIISR